jgi:hypothetical protein
MPDESARVKGLWLIFGSTTICGKEVDNFQSNRKRLSASVGTDLRIFLGGSIHPLRGKSLTLFIEAQKRVVSFPPTVARQQPRWENEARLPEEFAGRKDGFPWGFPVFGANAPVGAFLGPYPIRRFAAALGPSGMTLRARHNGVGAFEKTSQRFRPGEPRPALVELGWYCLPFGRRPGARLWRAGAHPKPHDCTCCGYPRLASLATSTKPWMREPIRRTKSEDVQDDRGENRFRGHLRPGAREERRNGGLADQWAAPPISFRASSPRALARDPRTRCSQCRRSP